jgi:hypothetical protein
MWEGGDGRWKMGDGRWATPQLSINYLVFLGQE